MTNKVNLACTCGKVKGSLDIVPGAFFHVHCLCCDCQNFSKHLNRQDQLLDAHGGTELFQTYPNLMKITEGQDKIACIQHTKKGLYRWYTTCCNTPLANTMNKANVPFVGISVKLMQFANDAEKLKTLGPVTMKAFGKYAIGEMPKDAHAKFPLSYMPKIIGFMIKGMLGKKNKPSPFFKDGKPVAEAKVLS
jgi:hypothetical protein